MTCCCLRYLANELSGDHDVQVTALAAIIANSWVISAGMDATVYIQQVQANGHFIHLKKLVFDRPILASFARLSDEQSTKW